MKCKLNRMKNTATVFFKFFLNHNFNSFMVHKISKMLVNFSRSKRLNTMFKNKTFLASTDSHFVKVAKHYLPFNRGNILRKILFIIAVIARCK
jgi:hypothetical protein